MEESTQPKSSQSLTDYNSSACPYGPKTMAVAPPLFVTILAEPSALEHQTNEKEVKPFSPILPDGQFGCMICGRPAHFGFDVKLRAGKLGRWSCSDHRNEVKNICR